MFSKRPRRDKILVAITALVATTATVVPLALIYGVKHDVTTTPVKVQPANGVEAVNMPTTDAQGYRVLTYDAKWTPKTYLANYLGSLSADKVAPDVAPKDGFALKAVTTVVTEASTMSTFFGDRVEKALASDTNETKVIDAGTKWNLVYFYTPASGFSGNDYTYTIRFRVEPLPVQAISVPEFSTDNVDYGEGLPDFDFNDRSKFPTPDFYVLAETPTSIKTYLSSGQSEADAVPVSDAKTVPAGSYVVVTFEMKPDLNHSGDTIEVKGTYIVDRAPTTNLPSPAKVTGLTLAYGTTISDPGPTQDQKNAAAAAKYKPYSTTPIITVTKVEQGVSGFNPPVNTNIAISDAGNLQTGSTFIAKWTAMYDNVSDPNHKADPSVISHEYTVVKGNFDSHSSGWTAYNATTPTQTAATVTAISIDATALPTISEAFETDHINAPAPFPKNPNTWRVEYHLLTSDGTSQVTVASMDDVRRYLNAPNSNYAPRLYATLFLPLDETNWKFNAPDANSPGQTGVHEFRLGSNIAITLHSSSSNP